MSCDDALDWSQIARDVGLTGAPSPLNPSATTAAVQELTRRNETAAGILRDVLKDLGLPYWERLPLEQALAVLEGKE